MTTSHLSLVNTINIHLPGAKSVPQAPMHLRTLPEVWGFAVQTARLNLLVFQRFLKNVEKPRLKFQRKAPNAMARGCTVNSVMSRTTIDMLPSP